MTVPLSVVVTVDGDESVVTSVSVPVSVDLSLDVLAEALAPSLADWLTVVIDVSARLYVAVVVPRSPSLMVPPVDRPLAPKVSESVHDDEIVSLPQSLMVGEPLTWSLYDDVLLFGARLDEVWPDMLVVSLSVS